jgi:ComEC/Rec2-related protein
VVNPGAADRDSPGEPRSRRPPRRPLLVPTIPAALALSATLLWCLRVGRVPIGLAVAALAVAALSVTSALPPVNRRGRVWPGTSILLLCVALGSGTGMARSWPLQPPVRERTDTASGTRHGSGGGIQRGVRAGLPVSSVGSYEAVLRRDSSTAPGQATWYELRLLRVASPGSERVARASGPVLLRVQGGQRLLAGRLVQVQAALGAPTPGQRPALFSAASPQDLVVGGYASRAAAWRAGLVETLRGRLSGLPPGPAGTLEALVLGSREEVPPDLYEGFRASGSLHLLALSGLHAGILYLLGSLLLRFVPLPGVRRLGASVLVVAYLGLAGFRPSLFRAVTMIVAGAAGGLLDRDARPLSSLALAAVFLLVVEPVFVLSLSFQLSFLAIAGILLLGPGLQDALGTALPPPLAAVLALSVSAQAATAPLLLWRFGSVHPVGILAALPLIPLVTGFIWGGIVYLLLGLTPAAAALAACLGWVHRAMEGCVGLFARVPPLHGAAGLSLVAALLAAGLLASVLPPLVRPPRGLEAR